MESDGNGFGYLEADDQPDQIICNQVLLSTLCKEGDRLFIQTRVDDQDDDPTVTWLDESQRRFTPGYASWRDGHPIAGVRGASRFQLCVLAVPMDGATVLLQLRSVQDCINFHSKTNRGHDWVKNGKRRWKEYFQEIGVPESHLVQPMDGDGANQLRVGSQHVSGFGLFVILAAAAASGPKKDERDMASSKAFALGCVLNLCGQVSFEIRYFVQAPGASCIFILGRQRKVCGCVGGLWER